MFNRKSRRESDEDQPIRKKSPMASPKTPKKNKTLNKSATRSDRSKSTNSNRSRSRSSIKRNPVSVGGKKSVESKGSKMSITPVNGQINESALELINRSRIENSDLEFGGLLGNLIITVSFPFLVILSKIAIQTKGILIPFPQGYLQYGNYFDQDVYVWSAALLIIQLIISLVPLAKKTEKLKKYDSMHRYRFSGFMNFVVCVLIVAALEYYKCSITFILDMVTKKTVPHVASSVVFALIISTGLIIIAKLKKQISIKLNCFQNFFIGSSLNPTLGTISIKLALHRYSLLSTILFNYLVIMDSLKNPLNLHLYVVAGLQIFYALDKLVFEFNLLPSYYLQKEKLGYWTIVNLFLQPAINFLPIQILLAKKLPVNHIILSLSAILFVFGYVCQRYCDFVKYKYETSSYSTRRRSYGRKKFTDFDPWLYVRYPNYTGTIITHFAVMLLTIDIIDLNLDGLLAYWPVFWYTLYYVVTLSHRCVRVSTEGRTRYGCAWDQQFASKWNLIPKMY